LLVSCEPFAAANDLQLLQQIFHSVSARPAEDKPAAEQEHVLVARFREEVIGSSAYHSRLAKLVKQITHRDSLMTILHLGSGTGSTTRLILTETGDGFHLYTAADLILPLLTSK
jgi:hypothetical protein